MSYPLKYDCENNEITNFKLICPITQLARFVGFLDLGSCPLYTHPTRHDVCTNVLFYYIIIVSLPITNCE